MNAKTYLCAALFGAAALTACRFEDDDLFEESPALRIQHYNAEVSQLLCKPENGWVMQYFYGDDVMGLNLFCQFKADGTVRMAGDHQYMGNAYREDTSLWKMLPEDGPILAFNTYNDVISYFGDPQSDGEGLGGDYQFLVLRATEQEIVLRGQRHNAEVRLIPSESADWKEYIAACKAVSNAILKSKVQTYYLEADGHRAFVSGMSDGLMNVGPLIDYVPYSYNFIVTPHGLRPQRAINLGADMNWPGVGKFHELTYAPDSMSLQSEDTKITLRPAWPLYVRTQLDGARTVTVTRDQMPADMQTLFDEISALASSGFNQTLRYMTFGTSTESGTSNRRTGVIFSFLNANGRTEFTLAYTASWKVEEETLTITVDPNDPSGNFSNYSRVEGLPERLAALVGMFAGTYVMSADDTFNPSVVTMTSAERTFSATMPGGRLM